MGAQLDLVVLLYGNESNKHINTPCLHGTPTKRLKVDSGVWWIHHYSCFEVY